jgi:ABC-type maltose transport system permease subunit
MNAAIVAVLSGMIGPLVVASATWALMKQTHRRDPGLLTSLMVKLFAGKMVLFAVYVGVMLGVLGLHDFFHCFTSDRGVLLAPFVE